MWCDRHNVRLKTVVFNIKPKHTQFSTTLFVALACFSLFAVSLLLLLLLLVPFIVVSVVFLSIWFFFSCARLRFACTYEMHAEYLSWRGFFFAHQLSSYCLQRGVFDVFLNQNPTSFISKSFEWISWKISFKNVIKVVTSITEDTVPLKWFFVYSCCVWLERLNANVVKVQLYVLKRMRLKRASCLWYMGQLHEMNTPAHP